MFRLLFLPVRLALKILRLSLRFTGFGNAVFLAIGVAIGLVFAPTSGADLRQRLQARLDERRGTAPAARPVDSGI